VLWSLGKRLAPEGHFLCMTRGVIYFEKLESSYESDIALGVVQCQRMSKTDPWYGVRCRIDYDQWTDDEQLTRGIFGLCYGELKSLALAYEAGFRYKHQQEFIRYACRVTCSDRENSCDISGYYIPANIPFLAFGDSTYFLGHISIAAFYGSLSLLTDHFNDRCSATQVLLNNGLPTALLAICQQLVMNSEAHVTAAQIREVENARRPAYY
jgi:hypothetical protein